MISTALDRAGGIKWFLMLAEEHPPVFAALLSKMLPPPKPDDGPRDLVQIRAFVSAALANHSVELKASESPSTMVTPNSVVEKSAAQSAQPDASTHASTEVRELEICED
jgi:hypothetical protein